jgi:2-hydroxychromene-2-carboxylate isomerase
VITLATEHVTFYFDPACPWTWNTARWLLSVAHERGLTVDWRPLSLTVLNSGREITPQYLAVMEVGHATLRIVTAMRAADDTDGIVDLYTEVGRRLFYDRKQPSIALVVDAAEAVGLGRFASAAADTSHDAAIEASTHEAIQRGGPDIGSPVIVLGDDTRGFHGPIVSPPPRGEQTLRLWDALVTLSQIPGVYEIKHGREGNVTFGPRP